MSTVLIVYYSRTGAVARLARQIARGVEEVTGSNARIRSVPPVSTVAEAVAAAVPDDGAPYIELDDLRSCDAIILGSPTRFGNMAAPMKYFLDGLGTEWANGTLVNKPAAVFTSSSTHHGGQESTLLTMMIPLLHQGCLITGLPFTIPTLSTTTSGGSPYGATHVAGTQNTTALTDDESLLSRALGKRVAEIAQKLHR